MVDLHVEPIHDAGFQKFKQFNTDQIKDRQGHGYMFR